MTRKKSPGLDAARCWLELMVELRREQMCRHPDFWDIDKFMLKHMREYKPIQPTTMMPPNECFQNSVVQAHIQAADVVDGLISVHGIQLRHSWNLLGDDKAVDYTIREPLSDSHYVGVKFPAVVARKVSMSDYWVGSEGILGALQRMPEASRNKLLKQAGYEPD